MIGVAKSAKICVDAGNKTWDLRKRAHYPYATTTAMVCVHLTIYEDADVWVLGQEYDLEKNSFCWHD